ncbi:MAG: alpha/beta hydrolase [Thaumarchaeota archaeon]|nr:alpha/beta hydrolase [Nitrososphaerota archaeon]
MDDGQSMPVHPKAQEMLEKNDALGYQEVSLLDPVKAREMDRRTTLPFLTTSEPVEKIENHKIREGSNEVPIRIYWPKENGEKADQELYPVVVYFHGGGWVVGSLDLFEEICSAISNKSEAIVISVDYRLAPEHKFPNALDDCFAATKWAAANAKFIGGDEDSIIVAGDSAGGNLAAAVCLMAKEKGEPDIAMQVLIYPVTDLLRDLSKYSKDKYGPSKESMDWFIELYVRTSSDLKNALASPQNGDLNGLPPAVVITAEYDPLREQDLDYAKKLEQSGVKTKLLDYQGMVHGFVQLPGFFADGMDAIEKIGSEIRRIYVENLK